MRITNFGGLEPKTVATKLDFQQAAVAHDCELYSGALYPAQRHVAIKGVVDEYGREPTHGILTLMNVGGIRVGVPYLTSWVKDPRGCDCGEAVLFVKDGRLQRISVQSLQSKASPTLVGIDPPCDAPTGVVATGGYSYPLYSDRAGCENPLPAHTRAYYITYVNGCEEESSPSPASIIFDVTNGQKVTLTDPNTPPANMVKRNWYVYLVGGSVAEARYMGSSTTATFVDNADPITYPPVLNDTVQWLPPLTCVENVTILGDRVIVTAQDTFYISEPRAPHAYVPENIWKLDAKILGVARIQEDAVGVMTDGCPYVLRGGADVNVVEINTRQPLASKGAYVIGEGCVYYASRNGLCRIKAEGFDVISDGRMTEYEWRNYLRDGLALGYCHDQVITNSRLDFVAHEGSNSRKAFSMTTTGEGMSSAFLSEETGGMVFAVGNNIYQFRESSIPEQYRWRSKSVVNNAPTIFTTLKLVGDFPTKGGKVTVTVWGDGEVVDTIVFTHSDVIERINRKKVTEVSLELTGNVPVREVHLQNAVTELAQEGGAA